MRLGPGVGRAVGRRPADGAHRAPLGVAVGGVGDGDREASDRPEGEERAPVERRRDGSRERDGQAARMTKNEADLKTLLHPGLHFGHSNGWVQSREDVFSDFKTGKLHYEKINNSQINILEISKKRATVKMNIEASGRVNENEFDLSLHVLQVWVKTKKGWQLYARQSARI
jgi:hypothetical protein